MMDAIRDLRHGFRLLLRAPGFAVTAILTLALGIGATTALFTVVNAVLLEPLPFPDSNKLVQVWRSELPALTYGSASYPRYLDWRRDQRAFTELGAWAPRGHDASPDAKGRNASPGAMASASFFRVVGAPLQSSAVGSRTTRTGAAAPKRRRDQRGAVAAALQRLAIGARRQHADRRRGLHRRSVSRHRGSPSLAPRCVDPARPRCRPRQSRQQLPAVVRTHARRRDDRGGAARAWAIWPRRCRASMRRQVHVHRASGARGDHREAPRADCGCCSAPPACCC